jgi:hypothetical protein
MDLFDLSGRVALVTGGNGGIGLVLQPGFRMDRATPHTLRSSEPKFFNFTGPPRAVNFTRNIRILDQKFFIFAV